MDLLSIFLELSTGSSIFSYFIGAAIFGALHITSLLFLLPLVIPKK